MKRFSEAKQAFEQASFAEILNHSKYKDRNLTGISHKNKEKERAKDLFKDMWKFVKANSEMDTKSLKESLAQQLDPLIKKNKLMKEAVLQS